VLVAVGLVAWSGLAMAQVHGNPVPRIDTGQLGVGLSFESFNRDLQYEGGGVDDADYSRTGFRVDYGLAKDQALQFFASDTEVEPDGGGSFDGFELGIGYRQPVDITLPIANKDSPTAVFGEIRYATLQDGGDFQYLQYAFGYGGSYPASDALEIYAAILYSDIIGEVSNGSSVDVSSDDNLGLLGGVEFDLTNALRLSAEMHLLHETGFALMVQLFL
jgi:hypothetical protein